LELTKLSIAASGFRARVAISPGQVFLPPGGTKALDLDLRVPRESGFRLGKRRMTAEGTLALSAVIASPWDRVLDQDLHLPITPTLEPSESPVRVTDEVGLGYPLVVGVVMLLLFSLAFLRLLYLRSRPRLVGTLTVYHAGETLLEADLRGRKARLGKGPLRLQGASLEGSLKPVRRRDEIDHVTEPGVKVAAKANGAGRRGVIWSGESLHVGDFEILYTA